MRWFCLDRYLAGLLALVAKHVWGGGRRGSGGSADGHRSTVVGGDRPHEASSDSIGTRRSVTARRSAAVDAWDHRRRGRKPVLDGRAALASRRVAEAAETGGETRRRHIARRGSE